MMPGPVETNLLLLLDPRAEMDGADWSFVSSQKAHGKSSGTPAGNRTSGKTVYCFERREILRYLLFPRRVKKGAPALKFRKVLYQNDGLLSAIFDADKTAGYRAFAASHLPPPAGLRQRLISLLPLALRAEKRYLAVWHHDADLESVKNPSGDPALLEIPDSMFFSNVSGKLMLTSSETLRSGHGWVIKTTSCPSYQEVMEKEFATMQGIVTLQGGAAFLPQLGKRHQTGGRIFFTESYIKGNCLREVLHALSQRNDIPGIRAFLDRLDDWSEKYRAAFGTQSGSLTSCYHHLVDAFSELYGEHQRAGAILRRAEQILSEIAGNQALIGTITAHNDLWPGNFIVAAEGLVAIDWERAAENRAPFFDYYWMIISAVLEYHASVLGVVDYSRAFRLFLADDEDVTRHAVVRLKSFLERLGFDRGLHQGFLLLFLMEWSVQGYLALGKQTFMDRMAFGELISFFDRHA